MILATGIGSVVETMVKPNEDTAMTKKEFEELLGRSVSEDDYIAIEQVYMYHPAIETKRDAVNMYTCKAGMTVIEDMLPRSLRIRDCEERLHALNAQMENVKAELLREQGKK
jgi:chloramphenicol 3-O-phosphotransferase